MDAIVQAMLDNRLGSSLVIIGLLVLVVTKLIDLRKSCEHDFVLALREEVEHSGLEENHSSIVITKLLIEESLCCKCKFIQSHRIISKQSCLYYKNTI